MKVILFDTTNAFLTPGGKTTHAIKLQKELEALGINIQFSRWWDKTQEDFDIIHFLAPIPSIAKLAKEHGKKTFFSMIFDFESNKTDFEQLTTKLKNKIIEKFPSSISENTYWKALPYMDKVQFMHEQDRTTALKYFPKILDRSKTIIIPHAYDPKDFNISENLNIQEMNFPEKYLVSCANISDRKQSVLLAQYAKTAKVPIVFIGNASLNSSYYKLFEKEIDNKYVFYPGYVSKEWKDCIEGNASGFVLLSLGESGCIAVYEAAAYKLPLLLSNLPWAWGYDSPKEIYYCNFRNKKNAIKELKTFYDKALKLKEFPFKIHTWSEVADIYYSHYKSLLKLD